jgi:hypothetical protein
MMPKIRTDFEYLVYILITAQRCGVRCVLLPKMLKAICNRNLNECQRIDIWKNGSAHIWKTLSREELDLLLEV